MNTPTATKATSHHDTITAPARPRATAPTSPPAAIHLSAVSGIDVASGRPASSSRACAVRPTARKNASAVAPSRPPSNVGATAAPMATYDRCQAVYGGCSNVR